MVFGTDINVAVTAFPRDENMQFSFVYVFVQDCPSVQTRNNDEKEKGILYFEK